MWNSEGHFFCCRKQDSWTICRIFKKTSSMAAQRALTHTWEPPLPGATKQDLFSAMQASHFASESSSNSLQVAATAPSSQFDSKYGFQGQQQFQKPNSTQEGGSSCKVISFNCSPSPQVLKGPIILPFQTQPPSQKPMLHTAPPFFFGAQFGQPEQQITGFLADSSADVNADMSCRDQESATTKHGNTFSMNSEREDVGLGRLNFPFDLGADSSDDWKCNIPWESFLSPTVPAEITQY